MPTILLLPFLYLLGWLSVKPLQLFHPNIPLDDLALLGTIFTFIYFLTILPNWVRLRWREREPWLALGLYQTELNVALKYLFRGLILSITLISIVLITIFIGSWGQWEGELDIGILINAIALGIGVGFAEELIFRGWLLKEMNLIFGSRFGIYAQAIIFSFVHIPLQLGFLKALAISVGLFLLGIVLALRRKLDEGSLIGCIGLHGGLVGIWFLLNSGLIKVLPNRPSLLLGPGELTPNPVGGLIAICSFFWLIWTYRTAFAIGRAP